jgi:mRNA-degrading endonuclease RelE of RelBE toxin-antitoxin system
MFQVVISDEAAAFIKTLTDSERQKVFDIFRSLQWYPQTKHLRMKKLKGHDVFRIRVGRYRILCEIDGKEHTIFINDMDDRKDIYRK